MGTEASSAGRDGVGSRGVTAGQAEPVLRSCEAKLIDYIRNHWALEFGSREVRLIIEYQNGVPVLVRVTENTVREEKLR
jgi:hypothetical protein